MQKHWHFHWNLICWNRLRCTEYTSQMHFFANFGHKWKSSLLWRIYHFSTLYAMCCDFAALSEMRFWFEEVDLLLLSGVPCLVAKPWFCICKNDVAQNWGAQAAWGTMRINVCIIFFQARLWWSSCLRGWVVVSHRGRPATFGTPQGADGKGRGLHSLCQKLYCISILRTRYTRECLWLQGP